MRFFTGLRGKTVTILAVTIITAAASAAVATLFFFSRALEAHEMDEARDGLVRAWAVIEDDMDHLEVMVNDWATWDDTWNYVETRDPAYVTANLAYDSILADLKVSSLLILDAEGKAAKGIATDELWLPDLEASYSKARPSSSTGWNRIVRAGSSLHLAAAKPIHRSDGSGERRGTFVMTRLIDEALLARYSRLAGVSVRILPRSGAPSGQEPPGPPDNDLRQAIRLSTRGGFIDAVVPVPAAVGGTEIDVYASMEGGIRVYGGLPMALFIGAVVLIIVFAGMLAIILFEAAVLGRMRAMNAELAAMSNGEGNRARLTESGDDELAALARSMNGTLDALYSVIGERDAAIREIHHRVKNNLQVISSIVSLQAGKARSVDSSAFSDIRRRVMAIAYVHEELYLDREIEQVDAERLFSRLASMIADTYDLGARVRVDVDCGRFSLNLEQAVPIGLVVCEILSNSFSYAFPDGKAGSISVSAEAADDGELVLEIRDDGIGIEEGAGKGLGLSLVETLSRQIAAECSIARRPEGGTSFRMSAPGAAAR